MPKKRSARIGQRLGPVLSHAAAAVVDAAATGEYQGLNFYGSYDPTSDADRKLHRWATTMVDTFPGVSVSVVPRQRKRSPPSCPACHAAVAQCPAAAPFYRVISNLMLNAVKHTGRGGTITLKCSRLDEVLQIDVIDNYSEVDPAPPLLGASVSHIVDLSQDAFEPFASAREVPTPIPNPALPVDEQLQIDRRLERFVA